jgi:hypothetical protein
MADNLKLYRFLKLPTEKHNNLFSHINIDKLSKELNLNTNDKFWCIRLIRVLERLRSLNN